MSDVFHEVDEQMRADKARALLTKAAPWAICIAVAALLVTIGYWGYNSYQIKAAATASDAYDAGVKAFNAGDDATAAKSFAVVAASHSANYRALGLIQQGQMAAIAGKPAPEAAAYYDKAAKSATSPLLKGLANLQAAYVLLDTTPYKDIEARLTPLADPKSAFSVDAKEALAFAKLLNGDLAGARSSFTALSLNPDATDGVKQRAQAAVATIDSGSAKTVAATVKAELAMPVKPRIPQDILNAMQQQAQQQQGQQGAAAMPGEPQ